MTLEGKGAGYALEAFGIDVLTTGAATLRELVSEIVENHGILIARPQGSHFTKEEQL